MNVVAAGSGLRVQDRQFARRSALLLEVVVALAVLVTAIGFMGAQLAGGLEMTTFAEAQLRGSLLADRILTSVQLDPNMQRVMSEMGDEFELEDEFGDAYPGYFWRVQSELAERETPELKVVTIQVLYQTNPEHRNSIDGAKIVRELGFLKAEQPKIDLVQEAGLSEDLVEQLRQAIPIAGFDPHAVDLQQLMSLLDPQLLQQLLPMLTPLLNQLAAGGLPSEMAAGGGQAQDGGVPGSGAGGQGGQGRPSAEDLAAQIRAAATAAAGQKSASPGGLPAPPGGKSQPAGGGNRPPAGGQKGPGAMAAPAAGQNPAGKVPADAGAGVTAPQAAPQAAPQSRPPRHGGAPIVGGGSGPNGEYTIEDLMRMRDEWERAKGGGQ